MLWSLFFKSFMHLYGTKSLEILKAIYGIWYLCRGRKCEDIDMDSIINFLTEGRGEWKYRASTNIPVSFHQAIMFPKAKMWIQFVCTRIVPALNVSNVNTFREILLYAIL
ncbi:hypothetical protein Goshw_012172 [Gossypium schwendimanii]|uniref:Uncharacterized protein n=2 Tax=Gossypium schwendimanii TaxID=34291 RepID=A0A7J9M3A7_GOSSC|nr:hypothetical protein [Gossypium schwendimanii]